MIIWSGFGILVLPIVVLCVIASMIFTGAVAPADYVRLHNWPIGVGLFVAAGICWFLGRRLRDYDAKTLVDPATGQTHIIRRGRSLFFIPMEWWSIPIACIGLAACFMNSTPEELRQMDAERAAKKEMRRLMREERHQQTP
jgi:hypothetical protein